MNNRLRALTRITLAAFLLLGAGACAWGRFSEGHGGVYYDEIYDVVIGFGVTCPTTALITTTMPGWTSTI